MYVCANASHARIREAFNWHDVSNTTREALPGSSAGAPKMLMMRFYALNM